MAIERYKKGSGTKLAENFRAREFDCQGTGCCSETPIDRKLVTYLQQIRTHFGKPVYLTAYRCKTHNARTPNASPHSRHLYGQAADFHIDGISPLEIAQYAESIGIKGIGLYDTFVHIDTRETKSFWYSHDQENRVTFASVAGYTLQQFVKDVQSVTGGEMLNNTVTLSAKKNRAHPLVKYVQKRLYALGYTQVGEADGIAGSKFTLAVKAFQKDNGCVADGEITARKKTWQVLLGLEQGGRG